MKTDLFAMNIAEKINQPIEQWLKFFSPARQEKILLYRFNADRNRTIWAELLVRFAVSKKFSCPFEKVEVQRDENGKPYIKNIPAEISLSHAGNWVVCSVGTQKSGVDVEINCEDYLEIAQNFFLPKEFEKIISLPEYLRKRQFLIYWTLKEGYYKLTGEKGFLTKDCELLLSGTEKFEGANCFLPDGSIIGYCLENDKGG